MIHVHKLYRFWTIEFLPRLFVDKIFLFTISKESLSIVQKIQLLK